MKAILPYTVKNNLGELLKREQARRVLEENKRVLLAEIEEELAEHCNLTRDGILRIKRGLSIASLPVAFKVAEFFDTKKCTGCPTSIKGRLLPTGVLAPYFNRQEIDVSKVLEGKKLELAWVEDPIAAFFLHIQGSGIVELPDGSRMRVNYAEANGQPYRAIGATLIERGLLTKDNVSMQSITKLLHEREDIRQEIMSTNPSYVFFREVEGGPFGNIEVALTPGRSIATDSRLFPKGALGFIQTRVPTVDAEGAFTGWRSVRRFVLNQDTGGAIRGPGRVDLFFGTGSQAGAEAGVMKQNGAIYFMLKKHGKILN
jgi:membrane-bound lytic murein transglycosylase